MKINSLTDIGSGKTGERFFHMTVWWCAPMVGLTISLCTMSVPARYFSMFLMVCSNAGSGNIACAFRFIPIPILFPFTSFSDTPSLGCECGAEATSVNS
jgi:hypothetical protein